VNRVVFRSASTERYQ